METSGASARIFTDQTYFRQRGRLEYASQLFSLKLHFPSNDFDIKFGRVRRIPVNRSVLSGMHVVGGLVHDPNNISGVSVINQARVTLNTYLSALHDIPPRLCSTW